MKKDNRHDSEEEDDEFEVVKDTKKKERPQHTAHHHGHHNKAPQASSGANLTLGRGKPIAKPVNEEVKLKEEPKQVPTTSKKTVDAKPADDYGQLNLEAKLLGQKATE